MVCQGNWLDTTGAVTSPRRHHCITAGETSTANMDTHEGFILALEWGVCTLKGNLSDLGTRTGSIFCK